MLSTSPCSHAAHKHPHHPGSAASRHRRVRVPPDADDDDIGHRFAGGDAHALRALYTRYAGPMLTAALHVLGGDRRLAEEAVQVAMVKAWRGASSYDPARPLAPWLFAIVRRCTIDIGRQERRHRIPSMDARAAGSEATVGDGVESAAAWAVRDALGALSAKEYEVMRLSYFQGLTHLEIAERLAIPVGTVKSRSASAHRRLRAELGSTLPIKELSGRAQLGDALRRVTVTARLAPPAQPPRPSSPRW